MTMHTSSEYNIHDASAIRAKVMRAIQEGAVRPLPRWRFVASSFVFAAAALGALAFALYVASVAFFLLRESGLIAELSLGMRGWYAFLHATPLPLLGVFALLALLSTWVVRHYGFAYRRPGIATGLLVLLVVCVGGYLLAQTTLHRRLAYAARHGGLSPLLGFWYQGPFSVPRVPEAYTGTIMEVLPDGFLAVDSDDDRVVHVVISADTAVAPGFVIKAGQRIVAVGDATADGILHAFGLREIEAQSGEIFSETML